MISENESNLRGHLKKNDTGHLNEDNAGNEEQELPGIIDDIQVNTVETKLIRRNLDEDNPTTISHLNKDNHSHLNEDNPGQENQKLPDIEDDILANKNNESTVVFKVMKLKLKPSTRKDMKITRRRNSVMAKVPDKNQIKITTMFKPTQRNDKMKECSVESERDNDRRNSLSEPNLKRPRFSEQVRESDTKNDFFLINQDFDESKPPD